MRLVIYRDHGCKRSNSIDSVAVITRTNGDGTCNLHVLPDGKQSYTVANVAMLEQLSGSANGWYAPTNEAEEFERGMYQGLLDRLTYMEPHVTRLEERLTELTRSIHKENQPQN